MSAPSEGHANRVVVGMLVVVALAVAAHFVVRSQLDETLPIPSAAPVPTATIVASARPVKGYDAALSELTRRRAQAREHAEDGGRVASRWTQLASYELTYARLTGDYQAYVAAEKALDQAFALARSYVDSADAGPLLLRAQLDYELHRMAAALERLAPIERQAEAMHDNALLAEAKSLRGAATFALGRYDEGLALLRESVALGGVSHKQRLAIALAKVGGVDEAKALWDESEKAIDTPEGKAWAVFQRGNLYLELGRYAEARKDLERANAIFPGFWLIEEHLAFLDEEEGLGARAIDTYRSLVERTRSPEAMDALAALVGGDEGRELRARARTIYDERLALLPEASFGHALDHFLVHERDATRALELARKNQELRPDGAAGTKLAQALLRAGQLAEARKEIEAVLATKWQSAETWATAATIFDRAGDAEAASRAEAQSKKLNPNAWADLDWL
jgi:tetratricopeptide (TPR) repeat protein